MKDSELIQLFLEESNRDKAFGLIVSKYQERLYWHIRKLVIIHADADDLLQNTFISAWKGLQNFREDAQLYTWLYRIATNETLTFLNSKKRKFFLPIIDYERTLADSLEADEYFDGNEIQLKLQKAILTLPEKQRVVFNLKYFEEMKYEEMSDILGTSVGALKASFFHAMKKIEKYLDTN